MVRTSPTEARARSLTAISPGRSGSVPDDRCCQRRAGSSATVSTSRYCAPERPGTAACTCVAQVGATAPTESSPVSAEGSKADPLSAFTTAAVSTYWAPTAS